MVQSKIRRNGIQQIRVGNSDNGIVGISSVLSSEQDSVSLSNVHIKNISRSGFSVNTINLDNSHVVALNVKVLSNKSTNVDDSQHISGIGLNRDLGVLSIIEQKRVGNRLGSRRIIQRQETRVDALNSLMVPIRQGNKDIFIIVKGESLIMNNKSLTVTIGILRIDVRVVPVSTVLIHSEVISDVSTRSNRTLSDHDRTVHLSTSVLEDTVEMDRGITIRQSIVHIHDNTVTLVNFNDRQWPLAIDTNHLTFMKTIGVGIDPCNVEIIGADCCANRRNKQRQTCCQQRQSRAGFHCGSE
ncbi:hypothetical protein AWJ20_663 [Sugiyamaella lignohabitans]|uniref:Uncharacterized protein n=1 Tax=Sugiyamaella lignohabitans TaxID=796027 RepID=A0A167D2V3_9ASCO|nr:uncharacterized protein AWJ20_663 [Sugiyamaella lignohabitans]ANB12410.1 hypothetical protein AWJ20_663 [Sugiyamaella lignohabitans]